MVATADVGNIIGEPGFLWVDFQLLAINIDNRYGSKMIKTSYMHKLKGEIKCHLFCVFLLIMEWIKGDYWRQPTKFLDTHKQQNTEISMK